jgi:hypothetical protein
MNEEWNNYIKKHRERIDTRINVLKEILSLTITAMINKDNFPTKDQTKFHYKRFKNELLYAYEIIYNENKYGEKRSIKNEK